MSVEITEFLFPLEKAAYLLSFEAKPGVGGDKQKFWRGVLGFSTAAVVRQVLMDSVSVADLAPVSQDDYGQRYQAITVIQGVRSRWRVKSIWMVRPRERVARFITAIPMQREGDDSGL